MLFEEGPYKEDYKGWESALRVLLFEGPTILGVPITKTIIFAVYIGVLLFRKSSICCHPTCFVAVMYVVTLPTDAQEERPGHCKRVHHHDENQRRRLP